MNPTFFRNYYFLFFFLPLLTFGQTVQITSVEDSGSFLSCNTGDHKDFVILPRPIDAKPEGKHYSMTYLLKNKKRNLSAVIYSFGIQTKPLFNKKGSNQRSPDFSNKRIRFLIPNANLR